MAANKPNPKRTQIKNELVSVLEMFPDRMFRTREIYELMDTDAPIREVSSVLYQLSQNKRHPAIQNPARGRYIWSKTKYAVRTDDRRTVKFALAEATTTVDIPIVEAPAVEIEQVNADVEVKPTPAGSSDRRLAFIDVLPVVDPTTATIRPDDSEMLLRHDDGSIWLAKKVN